jgi:hypothetical protein
LNKTITKKVGGAARDVGPEFKPQYHKKHKNKRSGDEIQEVEWLFSLCKALVLVVK